MVVDSLIKAAAVGGVVAMWSYFTLKTARAWVHFTYETMKICDQVVFSTQFLLCEECGGIILQSD